MSKYKFDMTIGHYVLNEDEDVQANDQSATNTITPLPALNSEEVAAATNKMQTEMDTIDKDLTRLNDNKVQLESSLATATEKFNSADVNTKESLRQNVIQLNAKLLQLTYDIAKKEKEKSDKKFQHISNIIQLQQKINESFVRVLPEKYRYLNESNIHTAKIYMRDLIANDDEHILKGMADFKRAFGKTELLYGKDKEGYFIVCVDQDDFNKMYDTLEETGYMRDVIIDNIMPQLFDRKDMIQ